MALIVRAMTSQQKKEDEQGENAVEDVFASSHKNDQSGTSDRLCDPQSSIDKALVLLLDPVTGSKAKGRNLGVLTIHVDHGFMTGDERFAALIHDKLAKDFKIGHLDKDDVEFVGQRVKAVKTKGGKIIRTSVDHE